MRTDRTKNRNGKALRVVGVPVAIVIAIAIGAALMAGVGWARSTVAPNKRRRRRSWARPRSASR